MPSTPTLTVTGEASSHRIRAMVDNPGTNPDHNDLHRRIADEYDGQFIKIAAMAADGTFDDYNVPADKSVDYFVRAVDAGGATADSVVKTASIALADDIRLHRVTKRSATTNLSGSVLTLLAGPNHDRESSFEQSVFETLGVTTLDGNISELEVETWRIPVIIPVSSDSTRTSLQTLLTSGDVLCLRTPSGFKKFGMLRSLREAYQNTLTEIALEFEVLDFSEVIV